MRQVYFLRRFVFRGLLLAVAFVSTGRAEEQKIAPESSTSSPSPAQMSGSTARAPEANLAQEGTFFLGCHDQDMTMSVSFVTSANGLNGVRQLRLVELGGDVYDRIAASGADASSPLVAQARFDGNSVEVFLEYSVPEADIANEVIRLQIRDAGYYFAGNLALAAGQETAEARQRVFFCQARRETDTILLLDSGYVEEAVAVSTAL